MTPEFSKIYRLTPEFEHTGEPRVRHIDRRDTGLRKHAYCSSGALDFIRGVEPMPGHDIVLVLAMSSSEIYGANRNGDAFAERPVYINGEKVLDWHETLPQHHQTFENGHNFLHHVNKDPRKAVGSIIKSFWNDVMHRVELLIATNKDKAGRVVERIADGDYPGVSMGCKIKYDICDLCGNRAPTRNEYCEHVNNRNPNYGLGKILPNGQHCRVWNPSPNLFDISYVWRPADPIGFMMKKVAYDQSPYEISSASLGEVVKNAENKLSAISKLSDIDKIISGEARAIKEGPSRDENIDRIVESLIPRLRERFEPLPDDVIAEMARYPLNEAVNSMNAVAIHPTVTEIYKIICQKGGLPADPKIAALLPAMQSAMLDLFSDSPGVIDGFIDTAKLAFDERAIRPELVQRVLPLLEKRALYKEYLARKYVPESLAPMTPMLGVDPTEAYYGSTQELFNIPDPRTGRLFQTTRGTAEQTDWDNKKRSLLEAGTLAAGTGLGYKALSMLRNSPMKTMSLLKWPLLLAGGGMTYRTLTKPTPMVQSSGGEYIPYNTPMVEKNSSLATAKNLRNMATDPIGGPLAGSALGTLLLASDVLPENLAPTSWEQTASQHPVWTALGGAAGLMGLKHILKKRAHVVKAAHVQSGYDGVSVQPVDIGQLCTDLTNVWLDLL